MPIVATSEHNAVTNKPGWPTRIVAADRPMKRLLDNPAREVVIDRERGPANCNVWLNGFAFPDHWAEVPARSPQGEYRLKRPIGRRRNIPVPSGATAVHVHPRTPGTRKRRSIREHTAALETTPRRWTQCRSQVPRVSMAPSRYRLPMAYKSRTSTMMLFAPLLQ